MGVVRADTRTGNARCRLGRRSCLCSVLTEQGMVVEVEEPEAQLLLTIGAVM